MAETNNIKQRVWEMRQQGHTYHAIAQQIDRSAGRARQLVQEYEKRLAWIAEHDTDAQLPVRERRVAYLLLPAMGRHALAQAVAYGLDRNFDERIVTVADLMRWTEADIRNLKNVSTGTIEALRAFYESEGLTDLLPRQPYRKCARCRGTGMVRG